MEDKIYNANIRIQNLSGATSDALDALAAKRNVPKWEVVRDALDEFVKNHKHELEEAA